MIRFVISILLVIIIASCSKPERTELTAFEKKQVDSLYAVIVSDIRQETDSICEVMKPIWIQEAVDSLKASYIEEIKEILDDE